MRLEGRATPADRTTPTAVVQRDGYELVFFDRDWSGRDQELQAFASGQAGANL